jgi:hypothetical protein
MISNWPVVGALLLLQYGCAETGDTTHSAAWQKSVSEAQAFSLLVAVQRSAKGETTDACVMRQDLPIESRVMDNLLVAQRSDLIAFGTPPYVFEQNTVILWVRSRDDPELTVSIGVKVNHAMQCVSYSLEKVVA